MADAIGWASSLVLLLTIASQVYKQWHEQTAKGVSRWLFTGQAGASVGFVVYSWMIGSVVFIVTNSLILLSALAGLVITARHRRRIPARDGEQLRRGVGEGSGGGGVGGWGG
jgi:MtN3 and saliva related transmembrane protein